ncbi:hypothetical protein TNCV_621821 [Trichonephila clavipes]|nr:hypothetical protein TNCV_621821 [Trichonephila clavipes]
MSTYERSLLKPCFACVVLSVGLMVSGILPPEWQIPESLSNVNLNLSVKSTETIAVYFSPPQAFVLRVRDPRFKGRERVSYKVGSRVAPPRRLA